MILDLQLQIGKLSMGSHYFILIKESLMKLNKIIINFIIEIKEYIMKYIKF